VLDGVLAVHLLDHQFAVAEDLGAANPEFQGAFERLDERRVLGDIVGRVAELFGGFDLLMAGTFDEISPSGRPWVAPGGASGMNSSDWFGHDFRHNRDE